MPTVLRHVDPTRPVGRIARAYAALAATRPATFVSRHLNWYLDPFLLRLTRGRCSSTIFFPTAVLETVGARTGRRRRNAIIYFHDGAQVTVVASNAGAPRHPAWFHNLQAHPEVTFGGLPMVASVVHDRTQPERLWTSAANVFPAFATYRRNADATGRTIPIVQLTPLAATDGPRTPQP